MDSALTPPRSALGGTALLMACACGVASNGAKLIAFVGLGATATVLHSSVLALAAVLITYGLWRTSRPSAYIALAAFVVLGLATALTPPAAMTTTPKAHHAGIPWAGMQLVGGVLYVAAAALLGYAFWRAFPTPKPAASASAVGGMALATGCTACCMVTGALTGLAITAGASSALYTVPLIFWSGLAVVTVGLYRLGGWHAARWVPLGGLIAWGGPELLELTGTWTSAGVVWRSVVSYIPRIAGAGVVLYGFAVAFRVAQVTVPASGRAAGVRVPLPAGVGGD